MNNSCGLQLSPSRFQLRFQSLVLLYSMRRSHFFTRSTETSEGVPRFTIGHFSGYPSLSAALCAKSFGGCIRTLYRIIRGCRVHIHQIILR
jgi:hypothetical protein